jgi:2-keto-4-pentenoate hydratase/2-oxohepta-3-ene-1,7-dioic acid hydratase in catechol pathway
MKVLSFVIDGRETWGVSDDRGIRELGAGARERFPDLRAALAGDALESLAGSFESEPVDPAAVDFLPPVPSPGKILCVGVNYRPHIEEMGREVPAHPVVFVRFADSVVGHGRALQHPSISEQYDFEGELAVIIGERAWRTTRDEAWDKVAGFTAFMDGSVRDWQQHTSQFTAGKNFRGSGAAGPWLVTRDEVGDVGELTLRTYVNGEEMQRGCIGELVFDIPALIAYCSSFAMLEPGDLIVTGTPGGVGAARVPPRWLRPGDVVEVDLGVIGRLANPVT